MNGTVNQNMKKDLDMDTKRNDSGEKFAAALNLGLMEKQKAYLQECQELLELGPTETARLIGTNFNTYKAWLYGKTPMPELANVALDCIIRNLPSRNKNNG
jgi:hypothetical protein